MAASIVGPEHKLYTYWRSSASWRVRIALAIKGVDYEYIPVHLLGAVQKTSDYQALNPMAQVPTLVTPSGAVLTQSLAIMEYLEESFPGKSLLPGDPTQRAHIRAMAEIVNSGIQPLQNLGVLQYIEKETSETKKVEWARHWIEKGLSALEHYAAGHSTAGRYCIGDEVSIADCCLIPQLYASRRFGADLDKYPKLLAIESHLQTLPEFIAAHADAQPDKDAPIPAKST